MKKNLSRTDIFYYSRRKLALYLLFNFGLLDSGAVFYLGYFSAIRPCLQLCRRYLSFVGCRCVGRHYHPSSAGRYYARINKN